MIIARSVPLHDKNWFKTGGPAEFFAEPTTPQEFVEAVLYAKNNRLPLTLIGEGANILISDAGIKGLVIRPALKDFSIEEIQYKEATAGLPAEALAKAGAGLSFNDLIEKCLEHNVVGLEEFSGIPGSVGGSVYINIHYFEFLLSQFLVAATVLNTSTGELSTVDNEWFKFGYDDSRLMQGDFVLVSATFKLKKVTDLEAAYAKGRRVEIIRHRVRRYPNSNTCGSFFRNFHADEYKHARGNSKVPYVAYYLDQIGVKGTLALGTAKVSHQHANMIVTIGEHPQAADVVAVVKTMQKLVHDKFGITPQPECQLLGFEENPFTTAL